jgi:hypothetical protein
MIHNAAIAELLILRREGLGGTPQQAYRCARMRRFMWPEEATSFQIANPRFVVVALV